MTKQEIAKIKFFRSEGLGYGAIATKMGLSVNTVKSFCRRNGLTGVAKEKAFIFCRQCGKPLEQEEKKRARKFCCEACRRAWWKEHPELITRQAYYTITCAHCGQEFRSYGNNKRKYCNHACYIAARFGGGPSKQMTCEYCGKEFTNYDGANRRYCGQACYLAARYGSKDEAEEGGKQHETTNQKG